jgi:predicted acylesterase/phospholipase RssA
MENTIQSRENIIENITFIPNTIILGPGGSKGILELGALKRLYEEPEYMKNVNKWIGISAGAAIGLLLVCGYYIDEIIELCMNMSIIDDVIHMDLLEAKQKLGLLKNKTVEEKLKECVIKKFGKIVTLRELYEQTNLYYCAVTSNLDKLIPEYLDKDTEPDLSCVEAAMMSMAVPILMQPRIYKGFTYLDGALGNTLPILKYDNGQNKILAIYISSEEDIVSSQISLTTFLYRLIQFSMKVMRDMNIECGSKNVKTIALKTTHKDTTGLSINKEARQQMVKQGYETADDFLKIGLHPEKYEIIPDGEEIPF